MQAQCYKMLLIACGALAREILTIIEANGWSHIELQCLPADLHLTPDRIPDAVEASVNKFRNQYNEIFVVYADCGTGGLLQQRCNKLGVEMMQGPHCYSFFEGNETFAATGEHDFRSFYLTDFLVRQFESFVIKPMGLDRYPELRDQIFGHYEKLVYLAQTEDIELDRKAIQAAQQLGLQYEKRRTGYGDLAVTLSEIAT